MLREDPQRKLQLAARDSESPEKGVKKRTVSRKNINRK